MSTENETWRDASSSEENSGAGLGLSICKSIIEQMNGTIEVASVLGEGSTFTVTFPCRIQLVESKHTE